MTVRAGAQMLVPRMARRMSPRDPSDIDGLTVWLQADRGVVLDSSGNVSEWRDLSGRGNHAVQATAGARPTYATAAGRKVVQTTRAARFMTIAATADTGPTSAGFTVYAAVSSSDAVNFGSVAGKWSATAADESWISMTNDSVATQCAGYFSEAGTNTDRGAASPGDASTGVPRVTALRYDPTGFVRISLDSATAAGGAIAGIKNVPTGTTYIGRSTPTLYPLDASISAIIIIQRYLAGGSAEDVFIRDYFRRMCGTP